MRIYEWLIEIDKRKRASKLNDYEVADRLGCSRPVVQGLRQMLRVSSQYSEKYYCDILGFTAEQHDEILEKAALNRKRLRG